MNAEATGEEPRAAKVLAPDAMAALVDRLMCLVREQEAQIRALRAMVETQL